MSGAHGKQAAIGPEAFRHADHAVQVIDGEHGATVVLDRIHTERARPDEVAVAVANLRDELLHGFCRQIHTTLEARHG